MTIRSVSRNFEGEVNEKEKLKNGKKEPNQTMDLALEEAGRWLGCPAKRPPRETDRYLLPRAIRPGLTSSTRRSTRETVVITGVMVPHRWCNGSR